MSTAVKFENISKQYRLGLVSTRTLSHDLNRWWAINVLRKEDPYLKIGETNDRSKKGLSEYVWALKDINFEVKQGERVGIIGRNGAGKSTLLKLLSQITSPTTGSIKAKGRIGALLEVGTGFHPEMTGKENIYMNGSILGMRKWEITKKLDEIVDFAGVERYLDTPVKRYSSGMVVRLGFAIAAYLEPEILVVDEVLAVGDAEFQKKAIGKMENISKGEGRTILFVSHNMAAVQQLCDRGVLIDSGEIICRGTVKEVITAYIRSSQLTTIKGSKIFEPDKEYNDGLSGLKIISLEIINAEKELFENIFCGDFVQFNLKFKISKEKIKNLRFGISFFDSTGSKFITEINTCYRKDEMIECSYGIYNCIFKINKIQLIPDIYTLNISATSGLEVLDFLRRECQLEINKASFYKNTKMPSQNRIPSFFTKFDYEIKPICEN